MMEKILQAFKLSLSKLFQRRFQVLSAALALGLLLCVLHYYTNGHSSSATMSLNYSEASSGLNPNSTRFNISELVSQSVMTRVLKAAGMESEITWDELAKCVSARSTDRGSGSSKNYISTTYQISYDQSKLSVKPKHLPNADNMMKLICDTYKSHFLENYGESKAILSYEPLVEADGEPYISISSLQVKLDQISRYINMRIKENKTFKDSETGASFLSLMKDVENLQNYDIENIYSFILETGVSKDKETLVALESYKNRIEKLSYDKFMAYYNSDNNGIKLYDEAMSAVVMIPSIDKSKEYYMSRTKTAADTMAKNADSELKEASSYKSSISNTKHLIGQISRGSGQPQKDLETAVSMIMDLKKQIDRISNDLKLLDVSYIKYKTQNYLVFTYSDMSFIQKINLKQAFVEVAAAVVLFYGVLFAVCLNNERKKKKDAKV